MKADFCRANCKHIDLKSLAMPICLVGYSTTIDPLVIYPNGDKNIPIYNKEVFINLDWFVVPSECPYHLELAVQ